MDIPPVVSHSSQAAIPICTAVTTATEVNLDSIFQFGCWAHTQCVCVCVCVCVWMHIKGRSISCAPYCHNCERGQDLDCQCPSWTIGHTGFERVYQGEGLTPICTVVTTVIGDQIVTIVNGQDMDYKWLVDGQIIPKLLVQTSHKITYNYHEIGHIHIICGIADSVRYPTLVSICAWWELHSWRYSTRSSPLQLWHT